ncbi:hypothetical protein EDC01DRAFT_716811 [Geopyxis carbonaria]|nr:hypothetical protein EDC01DRAFT_716811 [Geopyxis carbonaria]
MASGSASCSDVEAADAAKSVFRNSLHELLFIAVVTSAQLITQANLGLTILPILTIARGLGVPDSDPGAQSWFIASYSCTVGAFVLITGRLGDLYGRRTLFLIGWAWLTVFTLASSFAKSAVVFDILRALAGIGPSILMPNAAALLAGAWPGAGKHDASRKALAFVVFGAIAPAGYVGGGAWGAAIVERGARWEWIFWSLTIATAALGAASAFLVPVALDTRHPGGFDFLGSVVGVAGLVLVFVSINGGPQFGWSTPYVPVLLVVGVLLLALFPTIERRAAHPILPMTIFASPVLVAVVISLGLGWMSFGMFQYYNPHFLMHLRHVSGLMTSLQLLPCALIGIVAAALAVYALPRVPAYIIFGASMFSFFIGQLLLSLTPVEQTYWAMTFPTTLLIGFGPDLSFATASLIASDKLPPEEQGVAGSFINTVVNYSVAMGLALAGNVESRVNGGGRDVLAGYRGAFYLGIGLAVMGMVMTAVFHKGMGRVGAH